MSIAERMPNGTIAPTHGLTGVSGIYQITCSKNLVVYIGSAVNLVNRWANHRYDLRLGKHASRRMQNAWNKYGEGAFVFDVLLECPVSELIQREQEALDAAAELHGWRRMFNTLKVARSSLGYRHRPETVAKMTKLQRARHASGYVVSDETKAKIGAAHRGRKRSQDEIDAVMRGRARLGADDKNKTATQARWDAMTQEERIACTRHFCRPRSEEVKARMSEAQRKRGAGRHFKEWWTSLSDAEREDFLTRRSAKTAESNRKRVGTIFSDEHRAKISKALSGIQRSPETIEKLKAFQQSRREENSRRMKEIWAARRAAQENKG